MMKPKPWSRVFNSITMQANAWAPFTQKEKRERENKPSFIFQPKVGIHFSALVAIKEQWE